MTRVQAIFERGVFRPIEPVTIDDGAQVELTIEQTDRNGNHTADVLSGIAKLPLESAEDGFSGADHDKILYPPNP